MELGPNMEQLKKAVHRTSDWRERLNAVEELGKLGDKQSIDILTRVMANDSVYKVQEAAFHKLKELGEDVQLPAKDSGELYRGITKVLLRIKKSLPEGHTYEDFKEKLKKMRVDLYDTFEGDKGAEFDSWLENTWASLSVRTSPKK
ncbi:HEAT repeat domain-containing protein [Paenibacillus crassostreae]|nr:HEAT repeat domain-containing protein [Paenibacillus crassostreae]